MLEGGYNTKGGGLYSPLANSIYNHIYELNQNHGQVYYDAKFEIDKRRRKYEEISTSLRALPAPIEARYTR